MINRTRERVRQIQNQALKKLKRYIDEEAFEEVDEIDTEIDNNVYARFNRN